jgi:hypothetical protein
MAETMTPNVLSRKLTAQLHRTVTPKAIRSWARERIARFGDDKYTAHAYSVGEVKAITAAFAARGERSKAQSKPTSKPKSKPTSKPRVKVAKPTSETADA